VPQKLINPKNGKIEDFQNVLAEILFPL